MPVYVCSNAGAHCDTALTASDENDLMQQVSQHLKEAHNIKKPTQTIMNYLATTVRDDAVDSRDQ
ncbi:MAG: DUF1059 domain-containing protein [Actinomycetota bacterium]|nr:DUF1059 domain-containing protein [Actinomycetota bacterium]